MKSSLSIRKYLGQRSIWPRRILIIALLLSITTVFLLSDLLTASTRSPAIAGSIDYLRNTFAQLQQRNNSNVVLQRGVNVSTWFHDYQPHTHQEYENYINGIPSQLHGNGATYIRIWVNMGVFTRDSSGDINLALVQELISDLKQVEDQGIGVLVTPVPQFGVPTNQDITTAAGQYFLNNFWHQFGIYLSTLNTRLTFPEPINEPVLPNIAAFNAFQQTIVTTIREVMPNNTIIATGNNWSSIDGLLDPNFQILADKNVIYAIHFYEPFLLDAYNVSTWTWAKNSIGQRYAFSSTVADNLAVSNAPFPVTDVNACHEIATSAPDSFVKNQIDWYCNTNSNNSTSENTPALLLQRIHQIGVWARSHGVIVADTEFGVPVPHLQSVRLAWIAAVSAAFQQEGMGYSLWSYNSIYGFTVSPSPDFNVPRSGAPTLDRDALCVFQALNFQPPWIHSQPLNCASP